jgi:hypothetical protein
MKKSETHYVLIIHGTWNAPASTEGAKWYQKAGAFAEALASRLAGTPLAGAVWRSSKGRLTDFSWSGDNTHDARLNAATALCGEILSIRASDPTARIHLVAHSHGGNVVLKALELYQTQLGKAADHLREVMRWYVASEAIDHEKLLAEVAKLFPDWTQDNQKELRDSLLEFAQTKTNPYYFHITDWFAGDPQSHRIGRLIFLGTPFLRKRWYRHGWRSRLRVTAQIVSMYIVSYIIFTIVFNIGSLVIFHKILGCNIINWPWMLQGVSCLLPLGGVLSISLPDGKLPDVNNIYYHPTLFYRTRKRIEAFIVTAGQMDEALLGLSAEPFVDAYLALQMDKQRTARRVQWRFSRPIGAPSYEFDMETFRFLRLAGINVLKVVVEGATRPLWPILQTYLRRTLRKLILSHATGLPPQEFKGAWISARTGIGRREEFDEGKIWDISELASRTPSLRQSVIEEKRYSFLWSSETLALRLGHSRIWPQITKYYPLLERERADLQDDEERVGLQRACLVIEERAREVTGAVQLSHSGYYGHPAVLEAIVKFLISGQRPIAASVGASSNAIVAVNGN